MKKTAKLFISVVGCEMAGLISSIFTRSSIPLWYNQLIKPQLAPPNWIFAPVWTILFAFMGVSFYFIWKNGFLEKRNKIALALFVGQLLLNILWSAIFFGLKSPGTAMVEIIVLWLFILFTVISFSKVSKPAAWLLLPYLLWVSFAAYLNYSIWNLNS